MKGRLKSYLLLPNPSVLTICSSEKENSDFVMSKKESSLFSDKLMKSENNKVLSGRYTFPHEFPDELNTKNIQFVCFMGCNQLYHLFTSMFAVTKDEFLEEGELKEHVHANIDVANRNFPNAFFIFAERIKTGPTKGKVQSVPFEYLITKYDRPRPSNIEEDSWNYRIFAIKVITKILKKRFSEIKIGDDTFYYIKHISQKKKLDKEFDKVIKSLSSLQVK